MMRTSVSRLKAKLGQYMRAVREGREVTITDRDQPVARLVPYRAPLQRAALEVARPRDPTAPQPGEVVVRAIRYGGRSTTQILRADRDRR